MPTALFRQPSPRPPLWIRVFANDSLVMAVILLNTVAVLLLGFETMRARSAICWCINAVDIACLVFFCCEAAAKIRRDGWRGYWALGLNRFDFVLLVISAPAVVVDLATPSTGALLLVLRTCRLARLLRLLRFIPDRDHILLGVRRALKASVGLVVAMLLYNLVLSLWATHLFGAAAPDHFGDPLRSMFSIFTIFTVEGWNEIAAAVAEGTDAGHAVFARGFFVFVVLSGGLLGISLTTAVFVDEMVMDNNQPLERQVAALSGEIAALRGLLEQRSTRDEVLAQGDEP